MTEHHKQSPFDMLKPSQIFVGGIIAGFLVLCTIGFFILLGITLSDGSSSKNTGRTVPTNTNTGNTGNVVPTPTEVSIRPVDEDNDHIRGNVDASITLVEYSDFECPFCGRFTPTIEQILATYPDDVRIVYRHFPLRSIHPNAAKAAEASECAGEQGKFWEYHDKLFQQQDSLGEATYENIARSLSLNISKFTECMNTSKYAAVVQADETDGLAAGVNGTPHTVVVGPNGETIPLRGAVPFSQVQSAVDSLLN